MPDNTMRHGAHLGCGRPNFRHGRCRDAYLGRKCDGCDPDKQAAPAKAKSKATKKAAARQSG